MRVEAAVRKAFFTNGSQLFWPAQFVDAGLGDVEEVVASLRFLCDQGKLSAEATLHDLSGRDVLYVGPVEEALKYAGERYADELEADELFISLRFRLTSEFKGALGEERDDPKASGAGSMFPH